MPTLDDLDNKMKQIDKCKHYVYNNNDITKIVEEKKRFRKAPINYAVTKNELLKDIVSCVDLLLTIEIFRFFSFSRKLHEMKKIMNEKLNSVNN